jgi:hypothetical protein
MVINFSCWCYLLRQVQVAGNLRDLTGSQKALTGSPGRPLPAPVLSQTLQLLTASTVTLTDPGTLKASTPKSILPIRMMPGSGICSPSFRWLGQFDNCWPV